MYEQINNFFEIINNIAEKVFFADLLFFLNDQKLPLVVALLFYSACFFTIRMRFVNILLFPQAIRILINSFKKKKVKGEISQFKALSTALSASVGLGNIAGVAIAISIGGPGATFWIIVCGFLAMSTKFTEVTLAIMFREKNFEGSIMGGPMLYLKKGLAYKGWPKIGKLLAYLFCMTCLGGVFAGGIAFQVNQSLNVISQTLPFLNEYTWVYGLFVLALTGLVIIGGIKRIAQITSKIVPLMCGIYLLMSFFIIFSQITEIPHAFYTIIQGAFQPKAAFGGFVAVLITGMQRAFFSNEAGLGSSTIVHSAASVDHPVEEGLIALLEPFIDTVVICTITALVIVITGSYENPAYADIIEARKGAALTSQALGSVVSWFPYVLSFSVFLFAFSTIISWSYYGDRCFSFLFGESYLLIYKILVLCMVFMGAVATSTNIMQFGDFMILGMALPNLIGVLWLSNLVKGALDDYKKIS